MAFLIIMIIIIILAAMVIIIVLMKGTQVIQDLKKITVIVIAIVTSYLLELEKPKKVVLIYQI